MFVRVFDTPAGARQAPSRAERSFEIFPIEDDRYRLRLWGRLPRGWADGLFQGLARSGIAVLRGTARRTSLGGWRASFEIRSKAQGADPMLVDYLALASRRPKGPPLQPIFVRGHRLEASPAHGGSLYLEVVGPDRVGFLGGLLERLAFLSLVPEEMLVETGPSGVHDRFHLKTRDGRMPSPGIAAILEEILEGRLCSASSSG